MGKKIQTIGRYHMAGQTLGKGAFARVELALHGVTQTKVGIKLIDTRKFADFQARELFNREAKILSQLNHPNIIRMYETLKAGALYCIVTEYAPGGELLGYVRSFKEERLSECQSRPFIRQLISAIHYMHERGVVHRDLKMENILLDDSKKTVKIIDFGLSNVCPPGQLLKTHCGSPEYAAPELLSPKRGYGPEVDLWSLGIIMYALVTGRLPFWSPYADHGRKQKLLDQIEKGLTDKHEAVMKNLTPECRHLIKQLVEPNPLHRIPVKEVMSHGWITRNGKTPFVPFKALPKNHSIKHLAVEKLSELMKLDKAEIESIVSDNKTHEITTMYNLLVDDARKGTEYTELDHTLPFTILLADSSNQKRSACENWKLIRRSIRRTSTENRTVTAVNQNPSHVRLTPMANGDLRSPGRLITGTANANANNGDRPAMVHPASVENMLAAVKHDVKSINDNNNESDRRQLRDVATASARLNMLAPDFHNPIKSEATRPQNAEVNQLSSPANVKHELIEDKKEMEKEKQSEPAEKPKEINTTIANKSEEHPTPVLQNQTECKAKNKESQKDLKVEKDKENPKKKHAEFVPTHRIGSQVQETSIKLDDAQDIAAPHPYLRVRSDRAAAGNSGATRNLENNRSADQNSEQGGHSEKQLSLDSSTIDLIVSKLLLAAGRRPSILRNLLVDSPKVTLSSQGSIVQNSSKSPGCNRQRLQVESPSPDYRRLHVGRMASPVGASRRARSCASRASGVDCDCYKCEKLVERSRFSRCCEAMESRTDCRCCSRRRDSSVALNANGNRRKLQRFTRNRRKQKISFLQQSPSSESFDADDEGDAERLWTAAKIEPVLCTRCSRRSSNANTSASANTKANSSAAIVADSLGTLAHCHLLIQNGDAEGRSPNSKLKNSSRPSQLPLSGTTRKLAIVPKTATALSTGSLSHTIVKDKVLN